MGILSIKKIDSLLGNQFNSYLIYLSAICICLNSCVYGVTTLPYNAIATTQVFDYTNRRRVANRIILRMILYSCNLSGFPNITPELISVFLMFVLC